MHHSSEIDPEMVEEIKKQFNVGNIPLLGPTGKFPEGKLTKQDEGEISFVVFTKKGEKKVIINFDAPVRWMGMSPNQAIDLGNCLIKHARKLKK